MPILSLTKKEVIALNSFLGKIDHIDSGDNEFDDLMRKIQNKVRLIN